LLRIFLPLLLRHPYYIARHLIFLPLFAFVLLLRLSYANNTIVSFLYFLGHHVLASLFLAASSIALRVRFLFLCSKFSVSAQHIIIFLPLLLRFLPIARIIYFVTLFESGNRVSGNL